MQKESLGCAYASQSQAECLCGSHRELRIQGTAHTGNYANRKLRIRSAETILRQLMYQHMQQILC